MHPESIPGLDAIVIEGFCRFELLFTLNPRQGAVLICSDSVTLLNLFSDSIDLRSGIKRELLLVLDLLFVGDKFDI